MYFATKAICWKEKCLILNMHDVEMMGKVKEIISIPIRIDDENRFYFNYLLHNKTEEQKNDW